MKRMAVMLLSTVLLCFLPAALGRAFLVLVQSPLSLCLEPRMGWKLFWQKTTVIRGSGRPQLPEHHSGFVRDHSSFQVFKYEDTCDSFLLWQDKILPWNRFRRLGVTSMALADLNEDGEYELYFTYSFGSGIHRSMLGGFDPSEERVLQPEEVCGTMMTPSSLLRAWRAADEQSEITEYYRFHFTDSDPIGAVVPGWIGRMETRR